MTIKTSEKESIIIKTRKLLKRTLIEIHDGPLQTLKVIMDDIELQAKPESILNGLEEVGINIRNHLTKIKDIADKLEINPILSQGLDIGIKNTLQDLMNSEKLILKVINNIEPLKEPIANSIWIDMREDIYRFFKETINNVISHAQPPNGKATQVKIVLKQEQNKCHLIIQNNGTNQKNNKRKGGLGDKIMAIIADGLPNGEYKVTNSEDNFQVELTWQFDFT